MLNINKRKDILVKNKKLNNLKEIRRPSTRIGQKGQKGQKGLIGENRNLNIITKIHNK